MDIKLLLREMLLESSNNVMKNGKFVFNIDVIKKLYEAEGGSNAKISAFDKYRWRLKYIIESLYSDDVLKVRDPKTNKMHKYKISDLISDDIKGIENNINSELDHMRSLCGEFYYDEKHIIRGMLDREEFSTDIYPFAIYVSAHNDYNDTIGLMVESKGSYEMFEENEESSDETEKIVKRMLGDVDKFIQVFGSHNEDVVLKIKDSNVLPKNMYVTPDLRYAKKYWSSDEQRLLFKCKVNMNDIKRESHIDWKTMTNTPVSGFRILGNS